MILSASLMLLLLLGLSQANPLQEEEDQIDDQEQDQDERSDTIDITSRILSTNNYTDEFLMEGDLLPPKSRNAQKCWYQSCLWKKASNGRVMVPYTVNHQFSSSQKRQIASALSIFSGRTCIQFVPRSTESDYILIESDKGCFAAVGRQGGRQRLSLNIQGCMYNGIIQHEALHSLGFWHEHTRSDRDKYVRIINRNIMPYAKHNFNLMDTNNLNTQYDYSSIMHYAKTAFSIDGRSPTIIPKPNSHVPIGQRQAPSRLDFQKVNLLYSC